MPSLYRPSTDGLILVCNDRRCVSEPEWTRARPSLYQKSVIDYIITDAQLLRESGDVCIDSTDIGMSDHFLVWLELGRTAKYSRKQKRTIRRWRLGKFGDDVVREKYCEPLQAEVEAFSEGISQMEEGGMRRNELVEGVLKEWENIVNRVARDTVGEKVIVCGRSVRWWDDEIKAKIEQRRQLYKRMVRGQEGLWYEYNKLRREVKHLVME